MPTTQIGMVNDIKFVIQSAQHLKTWVVAICPDDSDILVWFRKFGVTLLPDGSRLAGRTVLLRDGAKASFADVSDPLFVPDDQEFLVAFLGWGDDLIADNRRMGEWRSRSIGVLDAQSKVLS